MSKEQDNLSRYIVSQDVPVEDVYKHIREHSDTGVMVVNGSMLWALVHQHEQRGVLLLRARVLLRVLSETDPEAAKLVSDINLQVKG